MKASFWLLIVLASCLLLASACFAQQDQVITPEQMGLNYSITAGAGLPITNHLNTNSAPTVGVSWFGMAPDQFGNNAAFGLSINWVDVQKNGGSNVNLVPLLFNYKRSGVLFGSYRIFTVLGVGLFMASSDIPEMDIQNGASFAWSVGAGIDVTNRLYFQARFVGGQNPSTDGLALVELGYRL